MNVLITHPAFGSIWLENAEYQGNYVVGDAWDNGDVGSSYMPCDYRGEYSTMNFPRTCIKKVEV